MSFGRFIDYDSANNRATVEPYDVRCCVGSNMQLHCLEWALSPAGVPGGAEVASKMQKQ